jgi:hypothetical protein
LAGAFLAVGLAGGGVAVASGHWVLPGADVVTDVATPVTVTGTGAGDLRLGPRPEDATHVRIELTCLTGGNFRFADGASVSCSSSEVGTPSAGVQYDLQLAPGQTSTSITTSSSTARWEATAWYINKQRTTWATNANGQTYGVVNEDGYPDLVAVLATNGRTGYAYAVDLNDPQPANPEEAATWTPAPPHNIPVYEADGVTVIGQFPVGG